MWLITYIAASVSLGLRVGDAADYLERRALEDSEKNGHLSSARNREQSKYQSV